MEGQHNEVLLCGIPRRTGHVVLGRDYGGWRTRSLGDAASRSALSRMPDAALRISAFRYARCCEDGAARGREPSSERRIRRDAPQRPMRASMSEHINAHLAADAAEIGRAC